MTKGREPATNAIRVLRAAGVAFELHPYAFELHGGTARSSRELGVDEHAVIKTLVMQDHDRRGLIVLMHGDREVSTRALARTVGARHVDPCEVSVAERLTGYHVGGISPFGTRQPLPVYMESSILELPTMYVNAGRRGLLVSLAPADAKLVLDATLVEVAIEG